MDIPVTFTYNNKEYHGLLTPVSGAGAASMYHVIVDKYYFGQFFYSQSAKTWVCHGQKPGMESLAAEFEFLLVSWYQ